ncbi:MAG: hypothetical protein JNL70_24495 [Saprospiraceae bacterium]|nr:hypothetical protein [Saprospiraceae bacterium]
MKNKLLLFVLPLSILATQSFAQGSLLDELGKDEETIEYAKYSFKTNRIINMHSLENTAEGVLDMKISHRFGTIDEGFYDLFGLDAATQRIGLDYGITDNLTVGVNRNSVRKAFDGFVKYRVLRQSTGKVNMPITLSVLSSMAIETQKWSDPTRENYFSSRLFYTHQLLIGRKFNDAFTLELAPTVVHRNLVATKAEKNTVLAMGIGGRVRLNRRTTFNAEYIYVLPNQLADNYKNSLSIGFDIETGGHVFQLHFTNSTSMSEYSYITQTDANWGKNAIRFGFNVSRVFTMYDAKKRKK